MTDEESDETTADHIEDLEAPAEMQGNVAGGAECISPTCIGDSAKAGYCEGPTCKTTVARCNFSWIVVVRDQ